MRSGGTNKRTMAVLAGVLAVLAAGPFVADAAAGKPGHRGKGIAVSWTSVPKPESPTSFVEPMCTDEQRCVTAWLGPARVLSGDLVGEALGGGVAAPLAQDAPGGVAAMGVFTLTDSPCGAGTLVAAGVIVFDPASGATARWEIVPGAGTGALAAARGSGRSVVTPDRIDYRGRIFCGPSTEG